MRTTLIATSLSGTCFFIGALYWAYNNEYIVINTSHSKQSLRHTNCPISTKKNVRLWFWHNDRWNNETSDLLWLNNTGDNIKHLIANWLTLLHEERIITKKVSVQTALPSFAQSEVYISFDRNILSREQSTFDKLMLIEGMLKTLRDNEVPVQAVWFLVNHHTMTDAHLDFSHAWPIEGFAMK